MPGKFNDHPCAIDTVYATYTESWHVQSFSSYFVQRFNSELVEADVKVAAPHYVQHVFSRTKRAAAEKFIKKIESSLLVGFSLSSLGNRFV